MSSTTVFSGPDTPTYVDATSTFNLNTALRPRTALIARDVAAVKEAVIDSAERGDKLVPLTTGHAGPMMTASPDVHVLKTAIDAPITVDTDRWTITFPAGATWSEIAEVAARHGGSVPHGSSGTVGAVGYLLGGGLSLYGRALGVASNHVESIRVVTADGIERDVDETRESELFWAIRGGGGGFGIVTSVTLRMQRLHEIITGMAVWPAKHASALLTAWREWARDAPRNATTTFRLLNFAPLPDLPPQLTSGQVVAVDGAIIPLTGETIDDAQRASDELSRRLLAVAQPTLNTWHRGPVLDLLGTHGDPQLPVAAMADSFTIQAFDDAAADAWLALVGETGSTRVVSAELRQLRGALAEPASNGGTYDHIDADVLVLTLDMVAELSHADVHEAAVLAIRAGMRQWVGPRTVPTLVDHPLSPRSTFDAAQERKVDEIRRAYDPNGVFALDERKTILASDDAPRT